MESVAIFHVGELPSFQYAKTFLKVDTEEWEYKKGSPCYTQAWDYVSVVFQY